MAKTLQQRVSESMSALTFPAYTEIPDVGLYLEQVTKYLNGYLESLGCPVLTGSMVSNYVKKGLVSNPVKKQYTREHIAWLLIIAITKNVLCLEDVQQFLQLLQTDDVRRAYEFFCHRQLAALNTVFHQQNICENSLDEQDDRARLLESTVTAVAHKLYLDRCFALRRG